MASRATVKAFDSVCWTCAKSSGGHKCPWVSGFKPVPGWDADQTEIWFNAKGMDGPYRHVEKSYAVRSCPLYEKESPDSRTRLNEDTAKEIATDIICRAVKDLKNTEKFNHGKRSLEVKENTGEVVYLGELEEFFRSRWMEILVDGITPDHSAKEIRAALGITEEE